MCNQTQNYVGKQGEKSLILMTSKECFLNDKQSWPFFIEKEIFTCKHVIEDN